VSLTCTFSTLLSDTIYKFSVIIYILKKCAAHLVACYPQLHKSATQEAMP